MLAKLQLNKSVAPRVAICVKEADISNGNSTVLVSNYIKPLMTAGVKDVGQVVFIGLPSPLNKNVTKAYAVPFIDELLEYCDTVGINKIVVADSKYFEFLVPKRKAEESVGYVFNVNKSGYEHIKVLPSLHHNILHFNPGKRVVIDRALQVLADVMQGQYEEPGKYVIKSKILCKDFNSATVELEKLKSCKYLAVDIETTGLRFERDQILTIAFADSQHSGVGIAVDKRYHSENDEQKIKLDLKFFFEFCYENDVELRFHNGLFDIKFLVRWLWMRHDDDFSGMYQGADVFSNYVDTMLITYLCLNSTVRASLGLKSLTQDFLGDYAVDATDCTIIHIDTLLEYNIADVCGTNFVYDKYYPIMVQEDQEEVFKSTFQPSCIPLIVMMMTGLPLDIEKVQEARSQLYETEAKAKEVFYTSNYVKRAEAILHDNLANKYNSTHKTKQKTAEDFKDDRLNPSSSQQLQLLLFDVLKFDVLETTDTGAPSVGGAVIKDYITQSEVTGDTEAVAVLNAVLDIAAATKVNGTFLSAFENLSLKHSPSGLTFLNGNLRLGGTQSGRLASNSPNLQNLPSQSTYGKLVKSCFVAPKGWLFCGADFNALKFGGLVK